MNLTNEVIKNLLMHRSIRKYKKDEVSDEVLNSVLEAASRASTTGNMQVYSIIVTRDVDRKQQLWPYHFKQQMVLDAPVLLTFCADFNRFNRWCHYRDAKPGYDNFLSFFTAAIDALLASQNAVVAAESLGLGICYLGTTTYMAGEIAKLLKCPQGVIPITTLTLGYPEEVPELTDRLPLSGIVHMEEYKDYDRSAIDTIYAEKESLPQTGDLLIENQLETLAQIFTQKRYTKKDNVHFSRQLLALLESQGFMNHQDETEG